MKIWTDRRGRVHAKGSGDLLRQMEELNAMIGYLKRYSVSMQAKAARISGADAEILMANEELRRQVAANARTIAMYDADMRKKAMNRGPKDPKAPITEIRQKEEAV